MRIRKPLLASLLVAGALLAGAPVPGHAQSRRAQSRRAQSRRAQSNRAQPDSLQAMQPKKQVTQGAVTVEGEQIEYDATAGTIILKNDDRDPTARMFYVAYHKRGVEDRSERPVTFFYNGGPGSASVWLHMGAFGPRRVASSDHSHTPAAPYDLVENNYSLLDATDLVFVDAVGTGYSRVLGKKKHGKGKPEDFYGIDQDAKSFSQFITQYLTENDRWNSPKYLFGESYGTTRSAALAARLATRQSVDLNGVILLSSILNFRTASFNAGNDRPYELFLPTYTAVAYYHDELPSQPERLEPLLHEVEQFALTDYARALAQGHDLSEAERTRIAGKLHEYTGLPASYIKEDNLRVTGSQFEHELLGEENRTVGRLDARFSGPTIDPMSERARYDPQSAAISSAYISLFNHYVHNTLHFGRDMKYRPSAGGAIRDWDWTHRAPNSGQAWPGLPNVSGDLAQAMKHNPGLQVMVNSGYYDLATPFFATDYTVNHLPIPEALQDNVTTTYYDSGHMVYVHPESLGKLHDNVAQFIESTARGVSEGRAGGGGPPTTR